MKVSTQLTVLMLACLAPIGLAYTVTMWRSAPEVLSQGLEAEARAAQQVLNASLASVVEDGGWGKADDIMSAVSHEGLAVALLDGSARLQFALPGFPIAIPARRWISARIKADGAAEFMRRAEGRSWFCRIEPLGSGQRGYLLLAQDWTALRRDRYRRIIGPLLADIGLLLAGIAGMPFLVDRYVTRPCAELRRRLMILGDGDAAACAPGRGDARLAAEEFRRLGEQLAKTHCRLLHECERRLQSERRLQRADQLAAIAALASGFAHEIGTPLGVIRGHAEMLLSSNFERSEARESFEVIVTQIDHIMRMVELLLDLGRRRSAIHIASDIRVIARRSIQLLEPEAARRSVTVIMNPGSQPLMVDCDPAQLEEVFASLEINALEAMAPEGGILRVNSATDELHGKVRLSFEDTGPGVPAAIRERIFDPFFTTKERRQGGGIGLAISRSIIGDHEGELILEQRADGACFAVILPASRPLERGLRIEERSYETAS